VAGVALLSFLLLILLAMRLRKLRREYALLRGDEGEERDIFAAVGRSLRRLDATNQRMDGLVKLVEDVGTAAQFAIQKFGIVRYNAFEEMGGNLSFSMALLDNHGDGLVLTSINGRTEARTYSKPIKALGSDHHLSEEEREAIAAAVANFDRGESETAATGSS
jgi:hypothetical protein